MRDSLHGSRLRHRPAGPPGRISGVLPRCHRAWSVLREAESSSERRTRLCPPLEPTPAMRQESGLLSGDEEDPDKGCVCLLLEGSGAEKAEELGVVACSSSSQSDASGGGRAPGRRSALPCRSAQRGRGSGRAQRNSQQPEPRQPHAGVVLRPPAPDSARPEAKSARGRRPRCGTPPREGSQRGSPPNHGKNFFPPPPPPQD
ncbi:basic salivary proline-rich protein 4-like [Rissa tridactyla]|uniref:basic salivary proline-rich protein 4-like n=1 Tax=Rissa tridactyla TaxID=75485 RepID=UPI0023BA4D7E|nr:basic salivary proline-rich protein 4-like [Rissa tridactyla]XP_054079227.1 basic salivary proline-rich protein 4-like [Rissa tridactyla]